MTDAAVSEQFNGPACFRIAELIQEEEVMTDLLDNVVEAHEGLKRWNELETRFRVSHSGRRSVGGEGQQGVLDDVSSRQPARGAGVAPSVRNCLPAKRVYPRNASR
jgi:hypothetical protein